MIGWSVYIVECSDASLYTGITLDVDRRVRQHNEGRGAKYTRGRGPVTLLASRLVGSKGDALKLEALIKKQSKDEKVGVLLSHGEDP